MLGKVACGWELESEEHHLELERGFEERWIQFASAVTSTLLDFRAMESPNSLSFLPPLEQPHHRVALKDLVGCRAALANRLKRGGAALPWAALAM